jgi:hypothetical protein
MYICNTIMLILLRAAWVADNSFHTGFSNFLRYFFSALYGNHTLLLVFLKLKIVIGFSSFMLIDCRTMSDLCIYLFLLVMYKSDLYIQYYWITTMYQCNLY